MDTNVLLKLIVEVGYDCAVRKIIARVSHKAKFRRSKKLIRQALQTRFPELVVVSARHSPLPDCFVYGELEKGLYVIHFSEHKMAEVMIFAHRERWHELLWISASKETQLIRFLPSAEGGIYPHCYDQVRKDEIPQLLGSYEPSHLALQRNTALLQALTA